MDEPTLEFFVEDSSINITKQQEAKIVQLLEPHRESIEIGMENFDEETMSWRGYRNNMWFLYEGYMDEIGNITNTK